MQVNSFQWNRTICQKSLAALQINQWNFTGGFTTPDADLGAQLGLALANEGEADMPEGYTIQLYISADAVIDGSDTPLINGETDGPVVPAGAVVPISLPAQARVPGDHPVGLAYLGINVDTSATCAPIR